MEYFDIGDYNKPVTTKSPEAQVWFNRGMMNCYGFNHQGSISCFKKAIEYDSKCAMAYWGVAYSFGPHYNMLYVPQSAFDEGLKYLQQAEDLVDSVSDWQKSLILASRTRYPKDFAESDQSIMSKALLQTVSEFKKVFQKYPDDLDISSLYVQALMNTNPWKLWSKDGHPTDYAIQARTVLEKLITRQYHPQICHLYIHLMQLSPFMKNSVGMADRLYDNIKGIAHLLHMPSHIYIQVAQYKKSVESNIRAVEAGRITKQFHSEDSFYEFYRAHDAHFVVWSAMFIGDYETAAKYSEIIKYQILPEKLIDMLGSQLEFFVYTDLHVLIRFGKWEDIIKKQIEGRKNYIFYRAMQRYSRTVAFAALGKIKQAQEEFELFLSQRKNVINRKCHTNTSSDVLDVGEAMARGEILYRKKQYKEAFAELRRCVNLSDNLVYDQPWSWMQPPRHALGALLLEQGEFEQSEKVYLEDLKFYPDNIWSLTGLEEIYKKLKNQEKLKGIQIPLKGARANAKMDISVSCFCKNNCS